VRILSKSSAGATTLAVALALLSWSCARYLPWRDAPAASEVNLAFTLERNLIELPTLRINNRSGRFLLATAAPRTVLDPAFAGRGPHALQISEKETARLAPSSLDLGGVADAMIGSEAWGGHAISIDYRSGLVTYQKDGIHPGLMKIFRYVGEPKVYVTVDGTDVAAVVDTTSPDTLVLPRREPGRGTVQVRVGGTDFGPTDVQYANVSQARIGNRLLSRFLVTIDYGKQMVGLWRDPRIPL
jgi:hypothetical protein